MSEPSPAQARAQRSLRRLGQELETWCFPLVGAALFLAATEFFLAWRVFPAAFSSWRGALENVTLLAGVYLQVELLLCLAAMAVWQVLSRRQLQVANFFALSVCLLVAGVVAFLPIHFLSRTRFDFPQTTTAFWLLSHLAAVGAALGAFFLSRKCLSQVAAYVKAELMFGLWFLSWAVACLLLAHAVFSPVHLTKVSAGLGVLGCFFSLLGMRYLLGAKKQWRLRVTSAAGLLFLVVLFRGSEEARFFQYTAASTAAPISAFVRHALDHDRDGAAGTFWGGRDCAPSDPARGPGQIEVAGDGVDQDCSGRDAELVLRPEQSGVLDGCAPTEPLSLLLIVVDAMRADALNQELMPGLWSFAQESLRYERAYSPSTMTRPSMGSMMTGLRVSQLYRPNVLRPGAPVFEKNLPQLLSAQGVKTMSVGWYPLDEASRSGFSSRNPLAVDVQPHKGQLLSAAVTQSTLSYLERSESQRFFVWAHYSDAHAPHALSDGAESGYPVSRETSYERSLEYTDYHLSTLLRTLARSGRLENTAVIITADHGEDLGERGRLGHGPYLFEDATHVPLVVAVPGCRPGVIQSPVSLSWLGATMAKLTGTSLPGRSLPLSAGPQTAPVVVEETPFFKTGMKRALIFEHEKLVVDVQNGGRALFDLKRDPGEKRNIYHSANEARGRLESLYQRWLDEQTLEPGRPTAP